MNCRPPDDFEGSRFRQPDHAGLSYSFTNGLSFPSVPPCTNLRGGAARL